MPSRLTHIVIDAADPAKLARFWSAALDWPVTYEDDDEVDIAPPASDASQQGQVPLVFVPVSDPKTAKNRVHLDLASRSDEHQAALVTRLGELGARRVKIGQGPHVSWVVMADPEGNELCVVNHAGSVGADSSSVFGDLWPVAAVVVDSPDPQAIAPFWSEAVGWPILGSDGTHVWLRDETARGPYLDIRHNPDPKTTKLRVHLDIAPHADDDQAAELARLEALGAYPLDIGQHAWGDRLTWHVLADPQGNELCLLSPR
jgi:predicted enzyme related to lactoylglutathione lyase